MKTSNVIGVVVLALLAILALSWLAQGNDWFMYKFWAPKYEKVRRETYEQTKSYKQGSVQRLNELCRQVSTADEGHKPMLNDIISHEFAEWDANDVPQYLRPCLADARAQSPVNP